MNKPCVFFQKGSCRFGAACKNSHDSQGGGQPQTNNRNNNNPRENQYQSDNLQQDQNNNQYQIGNRSNYHAQQPVEKIQKNPNMPANICNYFLQGKCTKEVCRYFHGYSESIQHINIEQINEKPIISFAQISDTKFLTADNSAVQIYTVTSEGKQNVFSKKFDGEKITKVIFSNGKVIIATIKEQMYENVHKRIFGAGLKEYEASYFYIIYIIYLLYFFNFLGFLRLQEFIYLQTMAK